MIPFAAAFGAATASAAVSIVDNMMGQPIKTWERTVAAANDATVRVGGYTGNLLQPNVIPAPDALMTMMRRGLVSDRMGKSMLRWHGVSFDDNGPPRGNIPLSVWRALNLSWRNASLLNMQRPGASTIETLYAQKRISADEANRMARYVDYDRDDYGTAVKASYNVASLATLLTQFRLGRITQEQYTQGAMALGWTNGDALATQERETPLPGLYDVMRLHFLGRLQPGEYGKYASALGHNDDRTRGLMESLFYQVPSGPELVNMAVRDVWRNDVVQRWGYDDEFPAPMEYWLRTQGWDWGVGFRGSDGVQYPSISWPKLFWRAHWNVLPPGLAYQMFRRLRPERIARYRQQFPGITPFALDDLRTVLKVHDYPPMAREWLAAINSQPLRMYNIRQAYQLGVRDRQWAEAQLLDLGYILEDAAAILDVVDRQLANRDKAWIDRLDHGTQLATAREVLAGYGDGLVPKQTAFDRLEALGLTTPLARQLIELEDSKQLRRTAREYLAGLRRDFLAGTMTPAELSARLQQARIAPPQAQRYVQRWLNQRSLERRQLSSTQVAGQVAAGALTPTDGLARLLNLGWIQPDAALVIQQATARQLHARALAAQQLARQATAQQKALVSAQRTAAQAVQAAQTRLRRITPLPTLKRWYCLGIRRAPTIQAMLVAQGYDAKSSQDYLREWAMECEQGPLAEAPAVHTSQQLVKRQTPVGTLKGMWQNGIITDQWARQRLAASGYAADVIDRLVALWAATLGKKPGPAPGGPSAPAQAPAGNANP